MKKTKKKKCKSQKKVDYNTADNFHRVYHENEQLCQRFSLKKEIFHKKLEQEKFKSLEKDMKGQKENLLLE